jgi:hypothetical protein
VHYTAICAGYWAPDPDAPGYLDPAYIKIDTTCVKKTVGYRFDLGAITAATANPAVAQLVYYETDLDAYSTIIPGVLWTIGIVFAGVATVILPINWDGRSHWNGTPLILQMVQFPFLAVFLGYCHLTLCHSLRF